MSETVIRVENLSKLYKLGLIHNDRLAEAITAGLKRTSKGLRRIFSGNHSDNTTITACPVESNEYSIGAPCTIPSSTDDTIWALRNVSFEVKRGEVLGIIGRNGAGKTTLLRILAGITEPTEGRVWMRGRIASLLEVGTGFHPELTGRENIFLNGAILGMTRVETKRKFDEIVDFAEIEKFIDTPVKRYSSGMYVRLAFAVAAHLEPEILIVDEVLAVGDSEFQKKAIGKMQHVSTNEGRTVLFVSHNMTAIKSLCEVAIQLDQGRLNNFGKVDSVVKKYLGCNNNLIFERNWNDITTAPGDHIAKIQSAKLIVPNNDDVIHVDTGIQIEFTYWHLKDDSQLNLSMHVHIAEGPLVFATTSTPQEYSKGLIRFICNIPPHFLNDETYSISIAIVKDSSVALFWVKEIIKFEVSETSRNIGWFGKYPGLIRPKLNWSSSILDSDLQ